MIERQAHIPNSEPPDSDRPRRPNERPSVPGEIPPTPNIDPVPIDEPGRDPRVKDPPPDERPNPQRY
jgi:hypothetical protein